MYTNLRMLTVAAVLSAGSSLAYADAVIDLFEGNDQFVVDATNNGATNGQWSIDGPTPGTPLASIIGGYRDIFVAQTGGSNGSVAIPSTSLLIQDGSLFWSVGAGKTATATVRWDGDSGGLETPAYGLGGIDLTALGSAFQFTVGTSDTSFEFSFELYTSATEFSKLTFQSEAHLNEESTPIALDAFFLPFIYGTFVGGEFVLDDVFIGQGVLGGVATSGFDLENINMIQIVLNSTSTTDLIVNDARVIPEPGTLALAGLTLVGLALQRRRKYA